MAEIKILVDDEVAETLVTLRRITKDRTLEDFVQSALTVYQWVLVQQAFDHAVISECPEDCEVHPDESVDTMLDDHVKDKELAREFLRDIID